MPDPIEKYTIDDLKKLKDVSLVTPITPSPGMLGSKSKYDTGFIVPEDYQKQQAALEYFKGERQPRLDKWANAVARLISKVGTEIAKTPGYIYALGEAGLTEKTLAESLDNAWLDTLQSLDDKTKEKFAIYTPKAVKEGNLWDNLTSASFWTNEGVDGAGFLIAMMAPGAALKGVGMSGKLAKLGMGVNTAQKVELSTATLVNSTFEALGEAKGGVDDLKKDFKIKLEKGEINPNTGQPWTQEEADIAINEAGKGIFMTNMALLLAPNYLMNKNLLGRFVPTKNTLNKVIDPLTGAFKEITPLTKKEIIGNIAKELGQGLFSEGFVEEGGQFSIEHYYKKLAKGETDKDLFDGLAEEYGNALTTTEGQKSIFLGGFFGTLAAIRATKELKDEHQHINKLSSILKENFDGFSASSDDIYEKNSDGSIKLDKSNNPIINPKKAAYIVANIALENQSSHIKDIYGMLGNKEAFDFLSNQDFTRFAIPYLQEEGGLEALNKHIDLLSKKLIDNKKQQEGIDDTFDENKYIAELKNKAKQLQKSYNSINDYINNIDVSQFKGNKEEIGNYLNRVRNASLQEVSKQLFLTDRIKDLNNEISELEIGTASQLPQVQLEISKKKDQVEKHNLALEESIDKYKSLFDNKELANSFDEYVNDDIKVEESINKAKQEVKKTQPQDLEDDDFYNPNDLEDQFYAQQESNDVNPIKQFAKRLVNGEKLESPEDLQFYDNNKEAIEKELKSIRQSNLASKLANLSKETQLNPEEEVVLTKNEDTSINESPDIINKEFIQADSKLADTIFKTESGQDDGTDVARNRYFRYIEHNNVNDKLLRIVTKNNNPKLYNEILEDNPKFKEFETKNPNYQGIFVVLSDVNGNSIKVDDKLVYATLTKDTQHLAPKIREEGQIDIDDFRERLLELDSSDAFLQPESKSKGIPEFLPKVNGERQSNSVIGRIGNSLDDIRLDLATQKGYRIENQVVDLGKLYAIDKDGRIFDLIPRLLNDSEIQIITDLIEQELGIKEKTVESPKDEIEKLIYFGISKKGIHDYTIGVKAGTNELTIGSKTLTAEQLQTPEGEQQLREFLATKHVNANSASLKTSGNYYGPITDESQTPIKYNSYKEYLLDGDNPMFGTDLVLNTEVQFRNIYIKYKPEIINNKLKNSNVVEESKVINDNTAPIVGETKVEKKKFERKSKGRTLDRTAKPGTKLEQSEINWFKSVLPNVNIEKVQGLIENKSLGRFLSNGQVLLSTEATKGTLTHEAFHAVTQLYLTESEINDLYKEAANKYPNKSRQELEEILAEDFVSYKETGKVLSNSPKRNTIFRKLLNFIKDLLGLNASTVQEVYRRLDKGYYSKAPVIGVREFSSLNRDEDKYKVTSEKGSKFVKDVLDGLDVMFFDVIYENGKTPIAAGANKSKILDILFDDFNDNYNELTDPQQIKDYEYILDNWDIFTKLWEERINSQGFELQDSTELDNNSLEDTDEDVTQRSGEAFQDANLVSTKSTMGNQSRLLIRSLRKPGVTNDLGLEIPVDFNDTYNFILKSVAGIGSSYVDLYNKLKELSKVRLELKELYERLGEPSSDLSDSQIEFQTQFLQDFNKTRTNSFITNLRKDGSIQVIDATRAGEIDKVKTIWENNLRNNAKETGTSLVIPESILDIKDDIQFLSKLGIDFHGKTQALIDSKDFDNREFKQSVTALRNYIKKNNFNVTKLFDFGEDIGGRIKYLLNLEALTTPNVNELSHINAEGKTIYSIGDNNGISIVGNIINNATSLDDLYDKLPHLNTVGARNSYWISKLFNSDGSRNKSFNISITLYDGLQSEGSNIYNNFGKTSTRKLKPGDLFVQNFNTTLLKGKSSYIVSSDKSNEFSISLEGTEDLTIPIESFKNGFDSPKLNIIFKNYFKSEFERIAKFELDGLGKDIDIYNKNGNKFTIFEFLPTSLKKEANDKFAELKTKKLSYDESIDDLNNTLDSILSKLDKPITDLFDKRYKQVINKLNNYNITNKDSGIAKELLDKKYSLPQLARAYVVNDMINSIEQVKLFIGDMAFYKDLYKRTAGNAGTKAIPRTDSIYNDYLNKNNKRLDKKQADSKINVVVFDDVKVAKEDLKEYIDALIDQGVEESLVKDLLSKYKEIDEGDAQGWITLDEYREFSKRLGQWTPLQEQAFDKMQSGKELTNNELAQFKVLKAQYFGPQEYNDLYVPTYHKFSLMPLLPQLVKGKNMSKVLEKMTAEQVGYALFKSGSKVGTKVDTKGEANKLYTKGSYGDINTSDWNKQIVYYQFLGIQTKTSDPKDKVVFGTQFRKLLWSGAFESGKETFEGAEKLFNEYNNIIKEQISKEKDNLIKELGLNTDNYTIEDVTNIVNLLQKEAKDRNLSDNIIDALDIEILEGKKILKYNIDSMVNKPKIDSMLSALINSRLIRQQVNGDAYVQGASSGFESIGERPVGTNPDLKFYRKDENGKTLPMEVMIPMSKNYYPLLTKYGSIDKLNKAIKAGNIDSKTLSLIGYRIPTQGMNSIDYMTIKEFLPEESGTLMILPTEIVAKSGGDYDIDKLNVFRPDLDKNGNYKSTNHNKIIDISKEVISNPSNFASLITPNTSSIMDNVANDIRYKKYANLKKAKGENPMNKEDYIKFLASDRKNIRYSEQLDPVKKIEARYKLWLAKDEVGPAAIANVYHTLSQIANLTLNKSYNKDGEVKEININLPHHETKDNKIDLSKSMDVEGKNKISEVLSQIINIVVDAAKEEEPTVNHLNMTMNTLPVYLYLNKMGVPFEIIGKFMTQPIINDYLQELIINDASFLKTKGLSLSNSKIITKIKEKYKVDTEGYVNKEFKLEDLDKYLDIDNQSDNDFNKAQLQILDDYLAYKEQSDIFTEVIRSTNFDTAGVGQNINSSRLKLQDIEKAKSYNFVNNIDNILNTFIGSFNQHEFSIDAYSSLYDTQSGEISANNLNLFNQIEATNFRKLSDNKKSKLFNLIDNDFINYVVQNYGYEDITSLKDKLFKTDSVAKRLLDLKNKPDKSEAEQAFIDNILIKQLYPLLKKGDRTVDNIKIYTKRFDTFTANQLTEAFRELKQMDLPFAQEFTKDLMDLGILQSGLNNSPITYLGIIPFEYYNELVKQAFNNFNKKNGAEQLSVFNQLFIRNNSKDTNIKNLAKALKLNDSPLGQGMYGKDYDISNYNSNLQTVKQPYSEVNLSKDDIINNENKLQISDKNGILDNTHQSIKNDLMAVGIEVPNNATQEDIVELFKKYCKGK